MKDLNQHSEALLLAVKLGNPIDGFLDELRDIDHSELLNLKTDDQIIAFWINIYNAFYQVLASKNLDIGKAIYGLKQIDIGGKSYSLDEIEHGVLRRGKYKYSLGLWKSLWQYKRVRQLRPSKLDFRIHFALNCGAKSCPPIAFYSVEELYEQLDQATISFLESETEIDHTTKTVTLSRLFLWFYNDFGRRKGIRYIVRRYLNQKIKTYTVKFAKYDWTLQLNNYVS